VDLISSDTDGEGYRTVKHRILAIALFSSTLPLFAADVKNVDVYRVPGRFGGWPANHGMWSWGNELLVGFSAGYYDGSRIGMHAIDHNKPEEHLLARSLDGGETWTIENPAEEGALLPLGQSLHGKVPPGFEKQTLKECPGDVDFTNPDFAMTVRMTNVHVGPSRFWYSTDRGHHWQGPFGLPQFDTPGIAARTDYIINGPHDCMLFLTAGKKNRMEGRPICVRTTDSGKTWKFVSFIGPEPKGFSIMPSTVRLAPNELLTTLRVHGADKRWIDAWESKDDGVTWKFLSQPVADTGAGNPPSLLKLKDGRLCLTYGYRAAPFGIRAKLSSDNGKTWGDEIHLRDDAGGKDIGYPRSVERPDGTVVVVYYYYDQRSPDRYIGATIWKP
jgi:hypothetical protein